MTTKRKLPAAQVPLVNDKGVIAPDWFRQLQNEAHVGEPATVAAAGAAGALPATPEGYYTVTINGVPRLVAYYVVPP